MQTVFEFGDAKLRARDIDPLYFALHHSRWSKEKLCRYTLAFVSFDLAGLACKIVDAGPKNFWAGMHDANAQTLRGAPRRYFRGKVASDAIRKLELRYATAERALAALRGSFAEAEAVMATWPQFGPTAIFKLCDMAERVCGVPVDFSDVTPKQLMSNVQVTKGVHKAMAAGRYGYDRGGIDMEDDLFAAMRRYKWATLAGPDFVRPLGMQEFETILCYYSHDDDHNRHMPGMDIENIKAELRGWGRTAEFLTSKLPPSYHGEKHKL